MLSTQTSSRYRQISVAHVELAEFDQARLWADKEKSYEILTRGQDDLEFQKNAQSAFHWLNMIEKYEREFYHTKIPEEPVEKEAKNTQKNKHGENQ